MKALLFSLFIVLSAGLAPLLAQNSKGGDESLRGRYFLVVWAYEGTSKAPKDSHTFAAFYDGADLANGQATPATISWLPVTGDVHLMGVEKGRNFTLAQTLAVACQARRKIASWGPYEINPNLYQRALSRIALLNSGRVAYSGLGIQPGTMNCIEAAGDIIETPFHLGISWGSAASEAVVRHLRPFFKDGGRINKDIAPLLISNECDQSQLSQR